MFEKKFLASMVFFAVLIALSSPAYAGECGCSGDLICLNCVTGGYGQKYCANCQAPPANPCCPNGSVCSAGSCISDGLGGQICTGECFPEPNPQPVIGIETNANGDLTGTGYVILSENSNLAPVKPTVTSPSGKVLTTRDFSPLTEIGVYTGISQNQTTNGKKFKFFVYDSIPSRVSDPFEVMECSSKTACFKFKKYIPVGGSVPIIYDQISEQNDSLDKSSSVDVTLPSGKTQAAVYSSSKFTFPVQETGPYSFAAAISGFSGNATGKAALLPTIGCPSTYAPVCCGGKTYNNSCIAKSQNCTSYTDGACSFDCLKEFKVRVVWNAVTQTISGKTVTISGYNVYRAVFGLSSFSKINSSIVSGTYYDDLTALKGKKYDYQVTAVSSFGLESSPSDVTSAEVSNCPSIQHMECSALKQCVAVSGVGTDLCSANSDCTAPGVCVDGDTKFCGSETGVCSFGTQTCSGSVWGSCVGGVKPGLEICGNGSDDDCDGVIDNGCACTNGETKKCGVAGVGACKQGTQNCIDSNWSSCVGSVEPIPEICGNGIDDDCSGIIDNGCPVCTPGQTRQCGSATGVCDYGVRTCQSNGKWSPVCVGGWNPGLEICANRIDDDCDGLIDEGCNPICATNPSAGNCDICGSQNDLLKNFNPGFEQGKSPWTLLGIGLSSINNYASFDVVSSPVNSGNNSAKYVQSNPPISYWYSSLYQAPSISMKPNTKYNFSTNSKGALGGEKESITLNQGRNCEGVTLGSLEVSYLVTKYFNSTSQYNEYTLPFVSCDNPAAIPSIASEFSRFCDGSTCTGTTYLDDFKLYPVCQEVCGNGRDDDGDGVIDDGCSSSANCGNGTIDSGEVCDGSNLNGKNCSTQGYFLGTLKCSGDCKSFDTSNCSSCGNGTAEPALGENCANCPTDVKCPTGSSCDTGSAKCKDGSCLTANDCSNKLNLPQSVLYCNGNSVYMTDYSWGCELFQCILNNSNSLVKNCLDNETCNGGVCVPATVCGNGKIESGENCATCPGDVKCAAGQQCTNGVCGCDTNSDCPVIDAVTLSCEGNSVYSTGVLPNCVNGSCNSQTVKTWIKDCSASEYCQNGTCKPNCGNGKIDLGETCSNCPTDFVCASGRQCNNGVCSCGSDNDCPVVQGMAPPYCVGNSVYQKSPIAKCVDGSCQGDVNEFKVKDCPEKCSGGQCVYTSCISNACAQRAGDSVSACSASDSNSCGAPTEHSTCSANSSCVLVPGGGSNFCGSGEDCLNTKHTECDSVSKQCVTVDGAGSDKCGLDSDCLASSHTECSIGTCVTVQGGGSNQCSTNSSCSQVHSVCQNKSCALVSGSGLSECSTSADCVAAEEAKSNIFSISTGTGFNAKWLKNVYIGETQKFEVSKNSAPVGGAEINVVSPKGKESKILTDSLGTASSLVNEIGDYSVDVKKESDAIRGQFSAINLIVSVSGVISSSFDGIFGSSLTRDPLILLALLLISLVAAILSYRLSKHLFSEGVKPKSQRQKEFTIRLVIALIAFLLPLVLARLLSPMIGIAWGIMEIAACVGFWIYLSKFKKKPEILKI